MMGRSRLRVAFATPALRRCQATAAVARIVDMATLVAVSVHLFDRSGAGAVAIFGVVRTIAPALGTPVVTAIGARTSPVTGLRLCVPVAAAGSAATAVLMGADGPLVGVYLAAGVAALALCCLRPLITALLPGHINSPAELVATNAAAALVDNVSTVIGPLLASAASAATDPALALWASAGLLLGNWVLVAPMTAGPTLARAPERRGHWLHESLAGMRTLAANVPVRAVVLLSVAQTFVRGAVNVLVVALAIDGLDMGEGGVGLLLGAIGVGGLLGFPVAVRVAGSTGMARTLGIALVLWGGPIALAAQAPGPVSALLLFAVVGVGNNLVDISSDTLLQRLVPHGSLPRVLGAFDATLFGGMAVGAVVAERLLGTWGLRPALAATGLMLPVLAMVTWRWLDRLDEGLRHRDAEVALLQLDGILSPLVISTVDHLVQAMQNETFAAGEPIIRKGEAGDRYLVVEDGEVEICDGDEVLAVLGPGDGFGELALLDGSPRNATAVARTAVRLRSLHRDDFLSAVRSQGSSHEAAEAVAAARRRRPAGETTSVVRPEEAGP